MPHLSLRPAREREHALRRAILLLTAMALMVVGYAGAALAATPIGTLDANSLPAVDPGGAFGTFQGDNYTGAQTFQAINSGELTSVQVSLVYFEDADIKVEITTTDQISGYPTNNALATAMIPAGTVTTPGVAVAEELVTVNFSDPAEVVAGQWYAIVLSTVGEFDWNKSNNPQTFQDLHMTQRSDGVWNGTLGNTAAYAVYVTPPAPSDTSPPQISVEVRGTLGNNDWYTSDVHIDWTVEENESAISSQSGCDPVSVTIDQAPTTYTCSATSAGGTSEKSVTIKRDATDPTDISFSGITDSASFYFGDVPAQSSLGCTAEDATSGLASCSISGYSNAVGTHTLTATATDKAGNSDTKTLTYEVLPWTIKGFYSPVDMQGTLNIAKAGSTVPLKFEVFKGDRELTNVGSVRETFTQKMTCPTTGPIDPIEKYATGKTSLRYDTTAGQYVFNWQTPKAPGSCYEVTMSTKDGSKITAYFQLK